MPPLVAVSYRPGGEADLDACTRIWRLGIEDYQARLNQPAMPEDLAPLRRLLVHLLTTDPERFWVACQGDDASVIGFGSASLREGLWFLAMLFVDPAAQADGIGQALMDRTQAGRDADPGGPAIPSPDDPLDTGIHTWGMCTDAVQPISNGIYARRGMVPRIPIWRMFGEVRRWSAVPSLPAGLVAVPFERIEHEGPDGERRLAETLDRARPRAAGSRPIRSIMPTCAARAALDSSPASRAAGRSATSTVRASGGWVRWPRSSRTCCRR